MCQIVVKPAGVEVSKEILRDAWQANDDGAGFAYRNEHNEVLYCKGYFKFKSLWRAYEKVQQYDVLLHFRLATHGQKTTENCHPFVVAPQVVVAHNGILYSYQPIGQDQRSDTRIFVDTVLAPALEKAKLPADVFLGEWGTKTLLETMTRGNKFAFLTPGGFHIFNEAAGEWRDRVWYSSGYPPDNRWMNGCMNWYHWKGSLGLSKPVNGAHGTSLVSQEGRDAYTEYWADGRQVQTVRNWERCEVCQEEAPKVYSLGGEKVCGKCWETFAQ